MRAPISPISCIVAGLYFAMMPISARAICTYSHFSGWLFNYDGTIGEKSRVRVTLTESNGELAGVYFYSTQLKDIRIRGRIVDGTRTVLEEMDSSGRITARFEGDFPGRDPRGGFGKEKLNCEVIVGSWHKIDAAQALPVYLSLENATSGTLTNRYAVAGAKDDALIHRRAYQFREAVTKQDKTTVASLIDYPIEVRLAGVRKTIRGPKELIAQYDAIFSNVYREAIATALPRNMFARDQGIMLGNGEVWFGANGKVIALNRE